MTWLSSDLSSLGGPPVRFWRHVVSRGRIPGARRLAAGGVPFRKAAALRKVRPWWLRHRNFCRYPGWTGDLKRLKNAPTAMDDGTAPAPRNRPQSAQVAVPRRRQPVSASRGRQEWSTVSAFTCWVAHFARRVSHVFLLSKPMRPSSGVPPCSIDLGIRCLPKRLR